MPLRRMVCTLCLASLGWAFAEQPATSAAAEVLGRGASMGQVKAGFVANMVAVDGNPLEDFRVLGRMKVVIKQGRMGADAPSAGAKAAE